MTAYRIGCIPGDGIGPEVVAVGLDVLATSAELDGFRYQVITYPYSGAHYLATGELVPDRVVEEWRGLDAVFLGAVGHPKVEPGLVERSVILGLRAGLDLYANVRPVKLLANELCPVKNKTRSDIDFVVVRENTEDVYTQIGGLFRAGTSDEVAVVTGLYTRKGTERVIRYAFDLARRRAADRRGRGRPPRVTMVDKANAIRPQSLWTRTFADVAREYPEVAIDHEYVDVCCMRMIGSPERYDVIVTTNLFGDIITDLGAALQGGMGMAASGNIHPGRASMFEPVHGSAPDIAGKGTANPIAAVLSIAMMLDHLGQPAAARRIESAIEWCLSSGRLPAGELDTLGTSRIGEIVLAAIRGQGKEAAA
jgi:3-isopropylmalate dehydrogenase